MPDITMCRGGDCPHKEYCYRFTATANEFRQSYFTTPPYEGDGCGYIMIDDVTNVPRSKGVRYERTIGNRHQGL